MTSVALTQQSLFRNVTAMVTAQVVVKLINFCVSIAMVRILGAQELGRYAYILALAYPFGTLADFGLAAFTIKEICRDRHREADLVPLLRHAQLWLASLGWLALMALATLVGHDVDTLLCLALAGFSSFLSSISTPYLVALTAREKFYLVSSYQVLASLLGCAAIVCGLLLGGDSFSLLLAATISNGAMVLVAYALAGTIPALPAMPPFSTVTSLIRQALPFGLLLLGFALYYRVDMIMLKWLRTTPEVGNYAAAYRFLDVVIPLAAAMGRPFYPRLSALAQQDLPSVRNLLEITWKPVLALSLPFALGICLVAHELTSVLFGSEFAQAGFLLQILIWGSIPLFLVNIPNQALMAANLVLPLAGAYGLTVGVNVIANLILIPSYGAGGAAISTVLCEWLILVLVGLIVRRQFTVSLAGEGLWRYGFSCAAMALSLWWFQHYGLIVEIAAGLLTYAASLTALGYLQSSDIQEARKLLAQ